MQPVAPIQNRTWAIARLESVAIGGYYPTPAHLVPAIADRLRIDEGDRYVFLDPCAGEGAAVFALMADLYGRVYPGVEFRKLAEKVRFFGVEMEGQRYDALKKRTEAQLGYSGEVSTIVRGDAFSVEWTEPHGEEAKPGASLLYLNPPYDQDRDRSIKRLEERFLRRFTGALAESGVLVFVVPGYALAASAVTLATHYVTATAFRFPEEDYAAYKQVVVFARKRSAPLLVPDPAILAKVERWAASPEALPVLTRTEKSLGALPRQGTYASRWHQTPQRCEVGFRSFTSQPLDLARAVELFQPWHATDRGGSFSPIRSVLPDPTADSLATRLYPMAVPPKPAHIAAGIAAGAFNGERVSPDDPASGAPAILVKGVFDREFHTVEEKTNKDGEVTGVVQVQQPKLVVTVLDLAKHSLHTVKSSTTVTGTTDPAQMTTGDLLALYGRGLLKVLRAHCPVLYDPADVSQHFPLPTLKRPLYTAQAHTVRASVMLLGGPGVSPRRRRGKACLVLGEIGCGKSCVSLATALACGATRILALCPPHLLQSWADQASAIHPGITVHVLQTVADVQAFAALKTPDVALAVLSRETAKLGHGWKGVEALTKSAEPACPKCGAPAPSGDLARKRSRCAHRAYTPDSAAARLLFTLGLLVHRLDPTDPYVHQMFSSRILRKVREKQAEAARVAREKGTLPAHCAAELAALRNDPRAAELAEGLRALVVDRAGAYHDNPAPRALTHYLAALDRPELTAAIADRLYTDSAASDPESYGPGARIRDAARNLLLMLPPEGELQTRLAEKLRAIPIPHSHGGYNPWQGFARRCAVLGGAAKTADDYHHEVDRKDGKVCYGDLPLGATGHFGKAMESLHKLGGWHVGPECGGELFQAVGEPMRYPLATYIARCHPDAFDFLIVDEGHEYSTDGSAQERAAHRLTGLQKPTVVLTGSVMNGYAESLFANWWALFRSFRSEFGREERSSFVERYGYRKRLLQDADKKSGEILAYGSMSDRVERREKDLGNAPGVLPLFVLRMLADCVTLHKADLALDLPPCREIPVKVAPDPEQGARHSALVKALMEQVKRDRFTKLAGKLWGQVSEVPSHLDRATRDTGNTPEGAYEVRYPESEGRRLVATAQPLGLDPLPKERELLDRIASEFAEGRRVMVLTWHVELMPRLQALILKRFGWKVPVLDPAKVPTQKRQAWIDKHVVVPDAPVLLTNPICVQTGLNNLVHFATQWWHENPACNPIVYRQGKGRSDRIGQGMEVRIYFPVYSVVSQVKAHSLLLHKVGVSMSTDGLDAESALQAAGVGEVGTSGFSVGKELYNLIAEGWAA